MRVQMERVQVRAGGRVLLDGLDLDVAPGSVLGLVGPNGSGKSTALRCLYRALEPHRGVVRVDGADLAGRDRVAAARDLAALPQSEAVEFDFTVEELVATGRHPHGHRGGPLGPSHREHVDRALRDHRLETLRHRRLTTLSGGERQRAALARAAAQDASVLVLDEPTNHLDLHHQLALLGRLRRAARTVIVALHDLNLAAAVCTSLAVLDGGRLVATGTPERVLGDAALLRDVFGVTASCVPHPVSGVPQLLYHLPTHPEENP